MESESAVKIARIRFVWLLVCLGGTLLSGVVIRFFETTLEHIHASDGEIGSLEDFIVDADAWKLRYMVVETKKDPPGRKVLIAPEWTETINWSAAYAGGDACLSANRYFSHTL